MISLRRQLLIISFMLTDMLIVLSSALVGFFAVAPSSGPWSNAFATSLEGDVRICVIAVALGVVWHLNFSYFGLYQSRRLARPWSEIVDILKATTTGSLLMYVLINTLIPSDATSRLIAVFWIASNAATISVRLSLRYILKRLRLHGRNLRHVVIIGTNARAREFASKITAKPELGYNFLGFIDADWDGPDNESSASPLVIADLKELSTFLRTNVIDEVVVCLPVKSFYDKYCSIVKLCEEQGIIVRLLPEIVNLTIGKLSVEQFDGIPVVTVYTGSIRKQQGSLKRLFDIVFAALLLAVLSPVFVSVAAIIKLTSPGPVFFSQERMGLNKRRFRLYKFRTMVRDAENRQTALEHMNEADGPVFKIRNDPRITPIGSILRKTSVDELPQLWNVMRGDLSLVGPRPLPVRDYEGFSHDWHRRRFSVRPGITCLWQVMGRHAISFDKWMELDMEYIDSWSFWLDMKILLKTIPAVIRGTGY